MDSDSVNLGSILVPQPSKTRSDFIATSMAYETSLISAGTYLRYVGTVTDGKGGIPNGTKIPVPNHKLK
jgi:hypothetical protein